MAKTTTKKSASAAESSAGSAGKPMDFDPQDVMKAMLARAQSLSQKAKGKGRADTDDEDEEDEEDGGDSDSDQGESGKDSELDGTFDEEDPSESSEAESSTSAQRRNVSSRKSKNGSGTNPLAGGVAARAPSTNELPSRIDPTSRVNASASTKSTTASSLDTPKPPPSTTFASLGLSQPLISALGSINIKKPTEIQSACVGPILSGRDCIGGAKTGSGKTMAFALPIVERIARDPFGVWAVILTPTRELAYQLTEQFLVVGKPLGLTTVTIVGGMDMMKQAKELEARPHIIVATPGRLCDLMRSDGLQGGKLSRVRTLVLDEADRLLTPTFAPDLAYIFSQIPPKRQTCLFTATVSEAIMDLANKEPAPGKQKPFVYRVTSDTLTVSRLKQKYLFLPSQIRDPYLYHLLHNPPDGIDIALRPVPKSKDQADSKRSSKSKSKRRREETPEDEEELLIPSTIIFAQRCATAHLLHLLLNILEIPSVPLHSHLTQPQRLLSLARFRAGEVPVLVTTDVGSRGLDIPEVAMVINWDCPRRSDDYIHRVGRTARAGRGGVAVTIVTERDVDLVKSIEDEIGVELSELELPEEAVLEKLNQVSLARRMATMEMHDSGFGERQATNKAKAIKRARRDAAK